MSLFIAKEALHYIGAPIVKSVINEIIKSTTEDNNLVDIKNKFHNY